MFYRIVAMELFILVIFIVLQIILDYFLIISMTTLGQLEKVEVFGVPIHLFLIVIINLVSLWLLAKIYIKEGKRKIEATETTHEEQFRSLVASVRSDRHDLNNHLTVISGLIKLEQHTSAAQYIEEFIGQVKINNKALLVENAVLASMLFSKMDLYQKEQVPFETNVKSEGIAKLLSSTDLIRLFSNLLDNAYEATIELSKGEQIIILELKEDHQTYEVIVKNSCLHNEIDQRLFQEGQSTKSSSQPRGFGLSIIQEIVTKYKGSLTVSNEDSLIVFSITFPKSGRSL